MKIAIGDIHGRNCWKNIDHDLYEEEIFIGDFFDSFDIAPEQIYQNAKEIFIHARKNIDKVKLILGNHDAHYLYENINYAGYNAGYAMHYRELMREYRDLFKVVHISEGIVFSHAGITNKWIKHVSDVLDKTKLRFDLKSDFEAINMCMNTSDYDILLTLGEERKGYSLGSPIWCDKKELMSDMLINVKQVVGHTFINDIETINNGAESVTFIDVLGSKEKYYIF